MRSAVRVNKYFFLILISIALIFSVFFSVSQVSAQSAADAAGCVSFDVGSSQIGIARNSGCSAIFGNGDTIPGADGEINGVEVSLIPTEITRNPDPSGNPDDDIVTIRPGLGSGLEDRFVIQVNGDVNDENVGDAILRIGDEQAPLNPDSPAVQLPEVPDGELGPVVPVDPSQENDVCTVENGCQSNPNGEVVVDGTEVVDESTAPFGEEPPDSNAGGSGDDEDQNRTCEDAAGWEMGWAVCPVLRMVGGVIDGLVGAILDFLHIGGIYQETEGQWRFFRNLARTVYSLAFIVVIYSVATGSFLSALDARRMASRLIITIIMVELSFQGLGFLIDVTDDIAQGIPDLFGQANQSQAAQDGLVAGGNEFGVDEEAGQKTIDLVLGAASTGAVETGKGLIGLVAVILAVIGLIFSLFGLFVLWIIVMVRNFLLLTSLVVSPLPLVFNALPTGQDTTKTWWSIFSKALLVQLFLVFGLVGGKFVSGIIDDAYNSESAGPLAELIVHIMSLFLTYGTAVIIALLVGRAATYLGGLAGIEGALQKVNPGRAIWGSDLVQENLNRARAGHFGGEKSSTAKWAQRVTNPLARLTGSRFDTLKRVGYRASNKANLANTELIGKYLKEIDTRGVTEDSYRESQFASTVFAYQKWGSPDQKRYANQMLSLIEQKNPTTFGNVMRNMEYYRQRPEAALAHMQALANMGKPTRPGENFHLPGFGNDADGKPIKFEIQEGFDTPSIAMKFMEDKGYDQAMVGVAVEGIGNASYGKGNQLDKYITAFDPKTGVYTPGKAHRNTRKSIEKAGPRVYLGSPENVNQATDEIRDWVKDAHTGLVNAQRDHAAGKIDDGALRSAHTYLQNATILAAQGEAMIAHPEQKGRQYITGMLDELTKGGGAREKEIAVYVEAGRKMLHTVGFDKAFIMAGGNAGLTGLDISPEQIAQLASQNATIDQLAAAAERGQQAVGGVAPPTSGGIF